MLGRRWRPHGQPIGVTARWRIFRALLATAVPCRMLDSVSIKGLRRITDLTVKGLAPLTIFVGRNGTAKSTILDAMLIGASPAPEEAVGRAVRRRVGVEGGARWLFPFGETDRATITISARSAVGGRDLVIGAARPSNAKLNGFEKELGDDGHGGPYTYLWLAAQAAEQHPIAWTVVALDNQYRTRMLGAPFARVEEFVRMIDSATPFLPGPVADMYTRLRATGRHADAERVLRAVRERAADEKNDNAPELIVGSEAGRSFLMKVDGNGVPLAASGDGARALVRGALEIVSATSGVILYEEPELHLHPGAQRELAQVMCDAIGRGVQLVISTHSLELIDYLLAGMRDALGKVAVFRTDIRDGVHRVTRVAGEDAAKVRSDIDEDLR